jgi:hypothetical protein
MYVGSLPVGVGSSIYDKGPLESFSACPCNKLTTNFAGAYLKLFLFERKFRTVTASEVHSASANAAPQVLTWASLESYSTLIFSIS